MLVALPVQGIWDNFKGHPVLVYLKQCCVRIHRNFVHGVYGQDLKTLS